MRSFLRLKFLVLGVALCLGPLAGSCAMGQTAPAAKQATESQPAAQVPADETAGFGDRTWLRRLEYDGFLQQLADEEVRVQHELDQGLTNPPSRINWSKMLHIHEDQEQAMRTLASDAWRRLKEINRRGVTSEELEDNPTQERIARLQARGKELQKVREQVLDEFLANLRQELGEDGFKNLDAYVYHPWGPSARATVPAASTSGGTKGITASDTAPEAGGPDPLYLSRPQ